WLVPLRWSPVLHRQVRPATPERGHHTRLPGNSPRLRIEQRWKMLSAFVQASSSLPQLTRRASGSPSWEGLPSASSALRHETAVRGNAHSPTSTSPPFQVNGKPRSAYYGRAVSS